MCFNDKYKLLTEVICVRCETTSQEVDSEICTGDAYWTCAKCKYKNQTSGY